MTNSPAHFAWKDEQLLAEPLNKLPIDSLTLLTFVMEIENLYDIELDEAEVNLCRNLQDIVVLVASARDGSH